MLRADLPPDEKERRAIERRRAQEQQRRQRIFNAKSRTIGVDTAALDAQVAEKKARAEAEKQRDLAYARQMAEVEQRLAALEAEATARRREQARQINEYRAQEQKPEQRREFDINDPNAKRNEKPVRVGDDDAHLGPSSGQVFFGEDLGAKERKKAQQEQLRRWTEQQIEERKNRKAAEELMEKQYLEYRGNVEQRAAQLEEMKQKAHKDMLRSTAEYNRQLAAAKHDHVQQERSAEAQANDVEIRNALTSDFMTENAAVAIRNDAVGRVVPYAFKGLSAEQRQEILDQQRAQIAELEARKAEEKAQEEKWSEYLARASRAELLAERERARARYQQSLVLQEQHRALSEEAKQREAYLNRDVYGTNQPSAAYFDQFNTSTR